jgi:hypothetical protein
MFQLQSNHQQAVHIRNIKENYIQAGLFLCDFFLCDFPLTLLENLQHFSNLQDNVQCNAILHRQYVIVFSLMWFGMNEMWPHVSHWRLAESDVTHTPQNMCMDWLCWWYKQGAPVIPPSSPWAFGMKMSEKRKSCVGDHISCLLPPP